jgi:hypothetical protein
MFSMLYNVVTYRDFRPFHVLVKIEVFTVNLRLSVVVVSSDDRHCLHILSWFL